MQPNIHVGVWRAVWFAGALLAWSPAAAPGAQPVYADDPLHRLAVQLADDAPTSTTPTPARAAPLAPLPDLQLTESTGTRPQPIERTNNASSLTSTAPAAASAVTPAIEVAEPAFVSAPPAREPRRLLDRGGLSETGTLNDTTQVNNAGGGSWMLQTITALGVVIGLILLLRAAWSRLTGQVVATGHSPVVEVLSRTTIAPRNQLLLIRLGQRILVVGDSPAGLRTLAHVDDPEEIASLLTAISAAKPNSISQNFSQLLNRFNGEYESDALDVEGGDAAEHRIDRARNSLSGLLARIRTAGTPS